MPRMVVREPIYSSQASPSRVVRRAPAYGSPQTSNRYLGDYDPNMAYRSPRRSMGGF